MRLFFLFAIFICSSSVFAQCLYDFDGDGVINFDADVLTQLSQYGLCGADLESDHNGDGCSDLRDLLEFTNYLGSSSCPDPVDQSDHILSLVLTEYYVHTEALNGVSDTIPAGSVTYRLYIELAEESDQLIAVYGDEISPLFLQSAQGFHVHTIGPDAVLGGIFTSSLPAFINVWPEVEYTSYLTIGSSLDDPFHGDPLYILSQDSPLPEAFENGEDVVMDSGIGSGVFNLNALYNSYPEGPEGLQLIGQFTTLETNNFSGTINAYIRTAGTFEEPGYGIAEGLTFSEGELSVLGCMDQEASNYDPEADYEDGSCIYPGDFNGDDEVTIEDLLIFIEEFGCMEDCGFADMNGDGVVIVTDLILFLGLIN